MYSALLIILFISPLIFQLLAPSIFRKIPFWLIILLSFIILILSTWLNLYLMGERLSKNNIRCGMPLVGIMVTEVLIAFILLVMVLVQIFIRRKKSRAKISN